MDSKGLHEWGDIAVVVGYFLLVLSVGIYVSDSYSASNVSDNYSASTAPKHPREFGFWY